MAHAFRFVVLRFGAGVLEGRFAIFLAGPICFLEIFATPRFGSCVERIAVLLLFACSAGAGAEGSVTGAVSVSACALVKKFLLAPDQPQPDATLAVSRLIETAAAKWNQEMGDYRDDITAIVVRMRGLFEKGNKGA